MTSAAPGLPLFHGRLEPDARALEALRERKVLAFAGIGDPEKFFAALERAGVAVQARHAFPDHHRFSRLEAADLISRAEREGLTLVTTEKDQARLAGQDDLRALADVSRVLPVELKVAQADVFRQLVLDAR